MQLRTVKNALHTTASAAFTSFFVASFLLQVSVLHAPNINFDNNRLQPVNVYMSLEELNGEKVVKVIKDSSITKVDEPTFVKINGIDFKNGTIEVKVLSRLLKDAPALARGFIG